MPSMADPPICIVADIVATSVSPTADFAALLAGDKVVMLPVGAGVGDFISPSAGDLGKPAIVGNRYIVIRTTP